MVAVCVGAASVGAAVLLPTVFIILGVISGPVDWWELITGAVWSPQRGDFGALSMLWGTAVVSVLALLIALPIGWSAALALHELTPFRWRRPLRTGVEVLAAVPSIVYGLLGVVMLRPLVSGLFGIPGGDSLLAAGFLLGVMVIPTVVSISVDALADVPNEAREAAAALGLTRTEVIRSAVLPLARGGMLAGGVLGLARALGETIAIFLVIGRVDGQVPGFGNLFESLISPGQTITTKLGGPEPMLAGTAGEHWAALCALGGVLLVVVAGLTLLAQSKKLNRPSRSRHGRSPAPKHRFTRDRLMVFALRALLAVPILLAVGVAIAIASRGLHALNPAFWITPAVGASGGGVRNQILGTLLLVGTAGIIAAFLGLALGIVMAEFASPRSERWLRTMAVTLGGVPTILLGLAGYWFFSTTLGWAKSWLAGAVLLAIIAVPVVALAVATQLVSLPAGRRETAQALGLSRAQVVRSVLMPHARPALITGLLLGLARAAGETAPLLFTATVFAGAGALPAGFADSPVVSLPTHVFALAQDAADPAALEAAWGGATVLVVIVVVLLAAVIPARRRLEGERL
ncbi:phosphate ABC transporter permease subunit PstC [Parasphingorhabdus pacifica]